MQNSLVLVNPHAGGGRAAALVAPIQAFLQKHAPAARLAITPDIAAARLQIQALSPGSRVVLVGGDGTLNQLLAVLLEGQHRLGLLPWGSGNDFARALGLRGRNWQDCLQIALHAEATAIDVGWLHTDTLHHPFASSLTVGFDSAIGYRALIGPRWLRGLPRYLLATLRELSALQTWQLEVRVDGELLHAGTALFASTLNTPSYAAGMPAVPHAQIRDGQLDLLIAGRFNRWQALLMLPRLLTGSHLSHPAVQTRGYRQLEIRSQRPIPLAADGEYLGTATQLRIEIQAGGLRAAGASAT